MTTYAYLIEFIPKPSRSVAVRYHKFRAATPRAAVVALRRAYGPETEVLDVYGPPLPSNTWVAGVAEQEQNR